MSERDDTETRAAGAGGPEPVPLGPEDAAFAAAGTPMLRLDPAAHRVLATNPAWTRAMDGCNAGDGGGLAGRDCAQLLLRCVPDDRASLRALLEAPAPQDAPVLTWLDAAGGTCRYRTSLVPYAAHGASAPTRRLLCLHPSDPPAPSVTEGLLRDALNAIGEAFVVYGPDGRLVLCNENFRRIYGYSAAEARPGVHFRELGRIDVERGNVVVGDEHGDGEAYLDRKAEYRRRLTGSFIVQLKDGRWLKTTDRRTSDGGFVSVQADVTELKQAEVDMAAAKAEAERSNRAKSDFLAKMSHELRTPLNAILGFSELLAGDAAARMDRARIRSYAQTVHDSGSMLLQLIDEILDLSKIEAGKMQLSDAEVDLTAIAGECLELVAGRARSAGVELAFDPPAPAPRLTADARALRQLLLNLLTNAVKFTPAGGRVAVELAGGPGADTRIGVCDTGVGIPAEDLERILRPFEQVAGSYARNRDGTGLGLTIAHALVDAHGGRLSIQSEPGAGTRVTASFPAGRSLP